MKAFLIIDTSMKVLIFEPIKAPITETSEIKLENHIQLIFRLKIYRC